MDIANYKTAVNRAGQVGHYPLSTETLDFIQEQIKLLQKLSGMAGYQHPWVVRSPDASHEGILLYNDELLPIEPISIPLTEGTTYDLCLRERKQEVQTLEDTYREARLYRTAYIATKGTDEAIGSVVAASTTSVHTPGAFTLAQLTTSVTSVENLEVSTEPGKAMLTTTDIDSSWLGRKRLYLASNRWAGDFISSYELDGAHLATQLLEGTSKSFIQELETKDGVRYRREYKDPDYFLMRGEDPFLGPKSSPAYEGWKCLPNQIIGSCILDIDPEVKSVQISHARGILSRPKVSVASPSSISIHPGEELEMNDPRHSRVECRPLHNLGGSLSPVPVGASYVQTGGVINISLDRTKVSGYLHLLLTIVSL